MARSKEVVGGNEMSIDLEDFLNNLKEPKETNIREALMQEKTPDNKETKMLKFLLDRVAELEQQLTWRDVSEENFPKEGNGEYICKIEGKQPRYEILQFDCFLGWNTSILGNLERISRYIPIPKE